MPCEGVEIHGWSGGGGDEVEPEQFRLLVEVLHERGNYPKVAEVIAQGLFNDDPPDFEFDFGLDRITDGLQVLVQRNLEVRSPTRG